ncbi:hypothetical protein [Desulfocurvibacter africanus]|uniref:Uncharacterized protein n=1 Tax=Desulfocurvibacter africanus subsp. africanus str. Walvis Bay TaxID=690850 RepID=F3YXV0_DESAF|nr:hypothetical protein [Desulfocurvibacter africanus]EGJ50652.1 hypothetical protein Desaf_2328 [Desulfocurvibacter africanus subsp. africanus str. Walvis Bay]
MQEQSIPSTSEPAATIRDISAHIVAFREFLNASWSCFGALRTQSIWEDTHTLLRKFLQANWSVLVESQLLVDGGRLAPYYTFLHQTLRESVPVEDRPTHYVKCEMPGSRYDLIDRQVALLGLVSRLDTGSGVYPPFDHVEMYAVGTSKVLLAPFNMVRFRLAEVC